MREETVGAADDIWPTISKIPLSTQPFPPPLKPPPPRSTKVSKKDRKSFASVNAEKEVKSSVLSSIDELQDFAMGRVRNNAKDEVKTSSASSMKDAIDRAEAKFRKAKELREGKIGERNGELREERKRLARENTRSKLEEKDRESRKFEDGREINHEKPKQKEEDDLELFFSMGARPSSAPRPSATTSVRTCHIYRFNTSNINSLLPVLLRPFIMVIHFSFG